jgi:hypothetical protein
MLNNKPMQAQFNTGSIAAIIFIYIAVTPSVIVTSNTQLLLP